VYLRKYEAVYKSKPVGSFLPRHITLKFKQEVLRARLSKAGDSKVEPLTSSAAAEIARRVLSCDRKILGVLVVDSVGRMLSFVESEGMPAGHRETLQNMERHSPLVSVMLGAAGPGDEQTGPVDYIVMSFREMKVLLIPFPTRGASLGVGLPRSALGASTYERVVEVLGNAGRDR